MVKKGQKIIKKKTGGNNELGIYNFTSETKIRFFADLEGHMPEEIENLIKNGKLIKNNLYETKDVVVFTGDLIDRGPRCIRNLIDMKSLKLNNISNVILTCGNRDLNKIRCMKEFWVNEIEEILTNNENINKSITELFELIKKCKTWTFKYNVKDIENEVKIRGINTSGDFTTLYSNDLEKRVKFIYNGTFGAQKQIDFFKEEYNTLFPTIDLSNEYDVCLFISMMNMVMGSRINVPKSLVQYGALYLEYLGVCHIIANITIGNKIIFASHSGIPYYKDSFVIPENIGKKLRENLDYINIKNINSLNKEFKEFLTVFGHHDYSKFDENYKKYIALSAACMDTVEPYNSELSPVVTIATLNDKGPLKYKDKPINLGESESNYTKIYNIFGHQPSGFLPGVMGVDNNGKKTYHIDLDISRAENRVGISNKISYVYLEITNVSDMLHGKTNGKILGMSGKDTYDILNISQSPIKGIPILDDNTPIIIEQYNINLDDYDSKKIIKTYEIKNKENIMTPEVLLFTVDDKNYYGACSQNFNLLRYTPSQDGGKNKNYKKSDKKFINGKIKRVIYLGKRGGEYIKVKDEYITLNKYKKLITKK